MSYPSCYSVEVRRRHLHFKPNHLSCLFFTNTGAAILSNTSTASSGPNIMKIGVIIQILFFGRFLTTIALFRLRLVKNGICHQE